MSSKLAWMAACLALSWGSVGAHGAESATATDLRRAVPSTVHMAVYAQRNSEREYQRKYLEEVWQTAQDEEIGERIVKLIASRMPDEKKEQARERWAEIREALEPISGEALANAEEFVYAQEMRGPFNEQFVAFRLSEEDAADVERGVRQVLELASERSGGKVSVETKEVGESEVTTLRLPGESPFHPSVARVGDVVLLGSAPGLLRASVKQLQDDSGVSKFDDPRFKEALEHLPEAEDALTIFDGQRFFEQLGDLGDFIRDKAGDDEKAKQVAGVLERIVNEMAILDYEVTAEYTEEGQNRAAVIGRLSDGFEEKLLGKALTGREPFEDWQSWVPADANSFSLSTGMDLHELYTGLIEIVRDEIPASRDGLKKLDKAQEKIGFNLDRDLLQNFSGECVSVRMPVETTEGTTTGQGVTAMKCSNPERIQELLARGIERLNEFPAVQAQELELVDVEGMDGYQELRANFFKAAGVRPVIGFDDGWLVASSHVAAAKKFAAVRAGEEDSLADGDRLEKFGIEVDGDVYAASYTDVGASIRQAADFIDKAAAMAPMFVGMAAAKAKPEDAQALQEAIGLLPSVAKVIRKFDYLEDRLSVTHEGPLPNTYRRESATRIRQPEDAT